MSSELAKQRFFFNKSCNYCKDTENLELDSVEPHTWVDESVWKLNEFEFAALFVLDVQILCNPCYLRKKRLWKSYRKEGGVWYDEFMATRHERRTPNFGKYIKEQYAQ